jgi:hypothetical protein
MVEKYAEPKPKDEQHNLGKTRLNESGYRNSHELHVEISFERGSFERARLQGRLQV